MRRFLLVVSISLVLVGCENDIDLVKNGVMEFNQTTTLGKALDNWRSCESRMWDTFETNNGVKVVQFTCQHNIYQYVSRVKSLLSQEEQDKSEHLDILSNTQTFQFTINQNNTFQIDNVQVKTIWVDGTYFNDFQEPVEQLKDAYDNELSFNPNELNKLVAERVSYFLSIIKMRAK